MDKHGKLKAHNHRLQISGNRTVNYAIFFALRVFLIFYLYSCVEEEHGHERNSLVLVLTVLSRTVLLLLTKRIKNGLR